MTTVAEAFPSSFLRAADLNNRTVKVAINKVIFEEIGKDKDKKPVMYFNGVKKGLVLNKTNAVTIAAMHGDQMEAWTGKEIEIFSMMVPFQGQNVAAIRVRAATEAVAAIAEAAISPQSTQDADLNDPLGI